MSKSEIFVAIFCAIFSSVGFWTFVNNIFQSLREKKSAERKALLGLLHEKLAERAVKYIERKYITRQEYQDFNRYIYEPYKELGGNGTGQRLKEEIDKLRIVN